MEHDILSLVRSKFDKYENFVKLNPKIAAECEAIIRWSSYLIANRKSPILGELLSSGANLLQLCNDIILRQNHPQLKLNLASCATQLKTFLSVIQSLELLAEIYARDNYGTSGKWAIITVIQILKASIKLILLFVFEDGISKSQPIVPLDRLQYSEITHLDRKFGSADYAEQDCEQEINHDESESKSLVLRSSGRKMRSIYESPPKASRFTGESASRNVTGPFASVQKQRLNLLLNRYREQKSAVLTERQLYGELLHITRPIAHLALMGAFGTHSWVSYFTSLMMDLSSLHLIRSQQLPMFCPMENQQTIPKSLNFNLNETIELNQRASSLLLYLLRSPFFDDFTKQRALEGIGSTAECIPFFGQFIVTLINYIPDWQKDYFRVWKD